ncbi:cupin domain-containing protein [Natronomonas sp. F2-12]|jgi:quercetin dioxygenase-like cupin family protein|uniref:Cupin domain-containing protein n=1 Tax=Natronomonas aquatica TaxID=2841590 RepID=A0A9R1CNL8_9EURY|nr:cupin domain-containing protein [Natronomonas aquatica]MCQ4332003.1 cupin domain-containing protein [Natronomonas aquatica]
MKHAGVTDQETIEVVDGGFLTQLSVGEETSAQAFEAEPGAVIPEHSHPHEQTGIVLEGTLTFLVDGEEIEIGPEESFVIPGGMPHGMENRSETRVFGIDVFSPARPDPEWGSDPK